MLDREYRPMWTDGAPRRPRHPDRLQRFMYGLAKASAIIDGKMKDTPYITGPAPAPRRKPVDKTLYGPRGEVLSSTVGR